jgi:hypothetical protein
MRSNNFLIILIISAISVFSWHISFAEAVNDNFHAARTMKSRYFEIYIEGDVDLDNLTMILSVPSSIKAIIREPIPDSRDLPNQLDTLFLAVSEIMDVRLSEFKCKIKICKDSSQLFNVAYSLFGREIQTGGFYVYAIDTLYVDAENVNIHILGHELSHAIQAHYFVVPPPATLQEVLAGYVEYQLRKYAYSLPE